jgi:hypothetical protein
VSQIRQGESRAVPRWGRVLSRAHFIFCVVCRASFGPGRHGATYATVKCDSHWPSQEPHLARPASIQDDRESGRRTRKKNYAEAAAPVAGRVSTDSAVLGEPGRARRPHDSGVSTENSGANGRGRLFAQVVGQGVISFLILNCAPARVYPAGKHAVFHNMVAQFRAGMRIE